MEQETTVLNIFWEKSELTEWSKCTVSVKYYRGWKSSLFWNRCCPQSLQPTSVMLPLTLDHVYGYFSLANSSWLYCFKCTISFHYRKIYFYFLLMSLKTCYDQISSSNVQRFAVHIWYSGVCPIGLVSLFSIQYSQLIFCVPNFNNVCSGIWFCRGLYNSTEKGILFGWTRIIQFHGERNIVWLDEDYTISWRKE